MEKPLGNAIRATFVIMAFTAMGNMLGLVREGTLAAFFGASALTDAYKVAFVIPYILLSSVSAAISTTFIPVYTEYKKYKSTEQVLYFLNNIFNSTMFITVIFTLAGMIFAPVIVGIVAPGFRNDVQDLTVKLSIFMLPSIIFLALSNLSGGYLQSNGRFTATALMGIPFNLLIIASIIFPFQRSIEIVSIGSMLGISCQFLIQVPSMLKSGYRFKPILFDFKEEGFKIMCRLAVPVFIGSIFTQVYVVIERALGSSLNEGSISALDYATKVKGTLEGIFILSILTVAYPNLSQLADDMESFKAAVLKLLKFIIYGTMPVMAVLLVLREPVVRILFERGVFSSNNTHITSMVLGCLSLGVVGSGVGGLLTKAFYSLKDTRTPVINTIISVGINILLCLVLVKSLGVVGMALSIAFTSLISCIILLIWLKIKTGFNRNKELMLAIMKALFAASIMGLVVYFFSSFYYGYLEEKASILVDAAGLVLSAGLGFVIYIIILKKFVFLANFFTDKDSEFRIQ
jgi:putative peptidoglycan lipid II flippase